MSFALCSQRETHSSRLKTRQYEEQYFKVRISNLFLDSLYTSRTGRP